MVSFLEDPRKKIAFCLFMGLLTAFGLWLYLRQARNRIAQHYVMTTALQAKKYIAKGKVLTPGDVEEVQLPEAYLQPTAIRSLQELKDRAGKFSLKARVGLLKKEQITKSKLYEENAFLGLAWVLSPDQVAVSLRLNSEQAVAGHVQPGDWVSVFCTLNPQPGWPQTKTKLLLERVQVLAVHDHVWNPAVSSAERVNMKERPHDHMLVTLGVSSKDAALLTLAESKGKVTLALVSPMSDQLGPPVSARLEDL